MLVLSRRRSESVTVGDGVLIHILEIDRHRVKLGITAPRDVKVLRTELVGRPEKSQVTPAA